MLGADKCLISHKTQTMSVLNDLKHAARIITDVHGTKKLCVPFIRFKTMHGRIVLISFAFSV